MTHLQCIGGVVQNVYSWNLYGWGYFGYATNNLTIDGFFIRGTPDATNDQASSGMNFGDYQQAGLCHHQRGYAGRLHWKRGYCARKR